MKFALLLLNDLDSFLQLELYLTYLKIVILVFNHLL